jgi:hypothetical protein
MDIIAKVSQKISNRENAGQISLQKFHRHGFKGLFCLPGGLKIQVLFRRRFWQIVGDGGKITGEIPA